MKLKVYGMTDIGRMREENQDHYLVDEPNNLLLVADGMGGMENGAAASLLAIEQMRAAIGSYREKNAQGAFDAVDYISYLKKYLNQTSRNLRDTLGGDSGTTLVLAQLVGSEVLFLNVGDSPGYLFTNRKLQQITRDHNMAGAMADMKMITRAEAKMHPLHNRLTAYVGMEGAVFASFQWVQVQEGDRLLLCSDGLSGIVDEQTIVLTLEAEKDLQTAVARLVALANEAGGEDNITVVLAEIEKV
jgi:PPM family protein phosphatase